MGSRSARMPWRPVLFGVAVIAVLVTIVGVLAATGNLLTRGFSALTATAPGVGTEVVAPEHSKAAVALADEPAGEIREATAHLAAQPTAYWLTPEQDPIGTAGKTVTALTAQARAEGRSVALVVYGLPGRDCGNHSAGGLDEPDYLRWTEEIGAALERAADVRKILILEPDSIALATDCGNLADRARQLNAAVDRLARPHTWIYVDGGHSGWHSPDAMAALLEQTGLIPRVRGVATNVSNYRSTADEFAFAHALSDRLGGTHAVVDTSRNGRASAGSEWCNPRGQRVGDPAGTYGDDVVDTNLWIKPPGESDGTCNGGPAAGVWWPEAAVELTREAR